jgi:hypothetical protein
MVRGAENLCPLCHLPSVLLTRVFTGARGSAYLCATGLIHQLHTREME